MELESNKFSVGMIINIILHKLDKENRKQYEITLKSIDIPNWKEFIALLLTRYQIFENIQRSYDNFPTKTKIIPNFKSKS